MRNDSVKLQAITHNDLIFNINQLLFIFVSCYFRFKALKVSYGSLVFWELLDLTACT